MPTLSLTQVIERQYELFKRIHHTPDNIKKVGKDNITQELLEARLRTLEKNWNNFQENHTIILRNLNILAKVNILSTTAMVQQKKVTSIQLPILPDY